MRCEEHVLGDPDFIGIMDAAKEDTGGIVMGDNDPCIPTVFWLEWPSEVQALLTA